MLNTRIFVVVLRACKNCQGDFFRHQRNLEVFTQQMNSIEVSGETIPSAVNVGKPLGGRGTTADPSRQRFPLSANRAARPLIGGEGTRCPSP